MFRTKLLLVSIVVGLGSGVAAQEFRATVSGHIYDSPGASVPNVKVQAVNVDTNETATATTDSSGSYSIPFLRPGIYKLTASPAGFKQFIRQNLPLHVPKLPPIAIVLYLANLTEPSKPQAHTYP